MEDLKIGVIGCGGRGKLAQNAHQPGKGSKLIAAADPKEKNLNEFREFCGEDVFTTNDYREMLTRPDIDAVFICSPDFLHEEHTLAALEAKKAVYLEKPMALTIEGCDKILEMAYKTGSKLYLGHNMRHFPVILKMKEIIDSGEIGSIQAVWCRHFINYGAEAYFSTWHSDRRNSTGLLLQKGAHDIDVIHWLSGGYTKRVVGMGKLSVFDKCERRTEDHYEEKSVWSDANWPPLEQKELSPIIDVEDHTSIMMQLDNGVQANYMQCHYCPDAERNYTFIGTKGRIENMGDHGNCEVHVWNSKHRGEADTVHKLRAIEGGHGGSDPAIVNEFINFVKNGVKTNTSPIAGRNSVAAGYLGTHSLREDSMPKDVPQLSESLIHYFENGQVK